MCSYPKTGHLTRKEKVRIIKSHFRIGSDLGSSSPIPPFRISKYVGFLVLPSNIHETKAPLPIPREEGVQDAVWREQETS